MLRQPVQLLRISGVIAFALTACQYFLVRLAGSSSGPLTVLEYFLAGSVSKQVFILLEQLCIWATAALLWRGTRPDTVLKANRQSISLVGLQVGLATLGAGDLLPLVAAQVGLLLPGRAGQIWLLGQMLLQVGVCTLLPGALSWMQPPMVTTVTGQYAPILQFIWIPVYHLLAYSLGLLGAVEAHQRNELIAIHEQVLDTNKELRRLNAELKATQQMEAEAARVAERMTIARELHDALGHHLAALSVNLQLATKLGGAEAKKAVSDAYLLARMLLSDVRHVVTDLRQLDSASLRQALETMAASIAVPKITVEFDENLDGMGPLPGHTLFRCAQEAITNTVRHAEAGNLWLRISRNERGYQLTARDDGRGAMDIFYGHGLTGMRERVQELGGVVRCETRPGNGFYLEVQVPEKAVAA